MPSPAWDNRIVEYDPAVPLDQLLAHPQNPKIHPRLQTDALKGILGEVGWLTGLLINLRTGYLIDGHDRVKAAMEAGQTTAPVIYIDVPEEMEPYVLATFDPVGTLAATDSAALTDLLHKVRSEDSAVQAMLAKVAEESGVIPPDAVDPAELWAGMPEFENQASVSWKQLIVHFDNEADYEAFAQLTGQALTPQTKSMWYPPRHRQASTVQVVDES